MARSPLQCATSTLLYLDREHSEMNEYLRHGSLELVFRDGVVVELRLISSLKRGKEFHLNFDDADKR